MVFYYAQRKQVKKVRAFITRNLTSIWLNIITMFYGAALITSKNYIRIIEPPMRYVLIFACFALPMILLVVIYKKQDKARGWLFIALAVLWWLIAWLYFINPVNNSGWILAISNVGHIFIHLYRGRFDAD